MNLALDPNDTALLLVDAQERLAAAMPDAHLRRALRNWLALLEMAGRLKLPVAVSEQYPKGLGPTLPVLKEALGKMIPEARYFDKLEFSGCASPQLQHFLSGGRRTLIVAGMECHICVYQTVRDLIARGCTVHVPVDAVLSRRRENWQVGVDLMTRAGAVPTSTETVLFDLVRTAGSEDFKALSKLVK